MTRPAPRSRRQRKQDTLNRLEHDVDLWLATADGEGGTPYLVPLSFLWGDGTLLIATPGSSPTGRNLQATGKARIGIGPTRDVTIIEGTVQTIPLADLPTPVADAFATKTGFDPRTEPTPYLYFRIHPRLLQTWREANELSGRTLMRDGQWLDET